MLQRVFQEVPRDLPCECSTPALDYRACLQHQDIFIDARTVPADKDALVALEKPKASACYGQAVYGPCILECLAQDI